MITWHLVCLEHRWREFTPERSMKQSEPVLARIKLGKCTMWVLIPRFTILTLPFPSPAVLYGFLMYHVCILFVPDRRARSYTRESRTVSFRNSDVLGKSGNLMLRIDEFDQHMILDLQ